MRGPPDMLCKKHRKAYQAMCEEDRLLLCIDCIIGEEQHRDHKLASLDQAYERYRGQVSETRDQIIEIVDMASITKQIDQRKEEMRKAAEATEQKLVRFTQYLISKIEQRRELVKGAIAETLHKEMESLSENAKFLAQISSEKLRHMEKLLGQTPQHFLASLFL